MSEVDRYLSGLVNNSEHLTGNLSTTVVRRQAVQFRVYNRVLQWKYEQDTEWTDLIELNNMDYEELFNLPTLNGKVIKGEIGSDVISSDDFLTNMEIEDLLQ